MRQLLVRVGLSGLLAAAVGHDAVAATGDYVIQRWQIEEGLPQNTVTSIAQDPEGYLWLSTFNGFVRFDGVRFTVFDQANLPELSSSRIVQLLADRQRVLWVGTEEGEVLRFGPDGGVVLTPPSQGSAYRYARSMVEDRAGAVWVLTFEGLLTRFERPAGAGSVAEGGRCVGTNAVALGTDTSGQVWMGTREGLWLWQGGHFEPQGARGAAGKLAIDAVGAARLSGVWVAADRRLRRWAGDQWVADRGAYAWGDTPVFGLLEDREGNVWVGTYGRGLFRYDREGEVLQLTAGDGLGSDHVRSLFSDREGQLWVGTQGGGLSRLKPRLFQVYGRRDGLASDAILAVCEGRDGGLWIGTNGDGVDRLRGAQVTHYGAELGLTNGYVWSLAEDRRGQLWAGTWGGGLFRLTGAGFGRVWPTEAVGEVVLGLYVDGMGTLWIGGQRAGGGVAACAPGALAPMPLAAFTASDVRTFAQDAEGGLWIGTDGDGLYRYQAGRVRRFGHEDGITSEFIWSLCAEADGTLWIGTFGAGLHRYRAGHFTSYTTAEGLGDNVICSILVDDLGYLWLSSYRGLCRVSKEDLHRLAVGQTRHLECVTYGQADGLPTLECAGGFQPAGCRTRDGRLWFPTIRGLVAVDPSRVRTNHVPPSVVIEELTVEGARRVGGARARGALTPGGARGGGEPVTVRSGGRRYEFHYTGLSFNDPEHVRFRYRLEGLERDWVEAGTRRAAYYSHLPPGAYRFRVIAANNCGVWNLEGAELALTVLPVFWRTGWFISLASLFVVGGVVGAARYFEKGRLQRRLERLERQHAIERERSRIAKDLHDDLGGSLTQITLLGELARREAMPLDEVRGYLSRITDRARELVRALDEIVWAVNPKNDSLPNLASYLSHFAQDFARVSPVRCRLDVMESLPELPLDIQTRHNLFLAVKEALNNVVKHSGASEMWLRVSWSGTTLTVTVEDDGRGFVPAVAAVGRNGLGNMRQRLEEVGGQLNVTSAPAAGTRVRMTLPAPGPGGGKA